MEQTDLVHHVEKLSETVARMDDRLVRIEQDQRALRSSVDQLTGEFRQLDKRLGDMNGQFDKRLSDMNMQFDKRLSDMHMQFDKRLDAFDKRLNTITEQFDKRLDAIMTQFDKRLSLMQWMIGIGFGLIILLMTLFRFLQLSGGATP